MSQPPTPAIEPVNWRYRLMVLLLTPLVALTCLRLAWRHQQSRYWLERLGGRSTPIVDRPLWFHAASVGEVVALKPLLLDLHERHPALPLMLTTTTPTGADIAARQLEGIVTHRYLPWDLHGAIHRFLDATHPRCAVIMETELWPTLYAECAQRGIAPLIINGRISAKTRNAAPWLRTAYCGALTHVAAVLARSEADAAGFRALGAAKDKVRVIGNIKLAPPASTVKSPATPSLHPRYVLAASTHADEEMLITRRWLTRSHNDCLLVIAPRHPERGKEIAKRLRALTTDVAVRSQGDPILPTTRIYLADTLGEMPWLMRHAEVVFMGGSLIPHGGHNVLEPAHLGKAIVTGPHMANFQEETALLLAANALVQIKDEHMLESALDQLLSDEEKRRNLESAALDALSPFHNVIESYRLAVETHCRCAVTP